MAIDNAVMEHLADLTDPVIDIDLGATQAQSGLTAHGDEVFPLPAIHASICDIAHLFRISTPEHLFHECIIVGMIITWRQTFKDIPMISKYLLKDVPSWGEI